jgi:hypothetical protein
MVAVQLEDPTMTVEEPHDTAIVVEAGVQLIQANETSSNHAVPAPVLKPR